MEINNRGFTLIEILIVIVVLGFVVVAGSNLFFGTLMGNSKAEVLKEVKQNGEYALTTMDEAIKNCREVVNCELNSITVKNKNNQEITFERITEVIDGINLGRIASNSSYLTSAKVNVPEEEFVLSCESLEAGRPVRVFVSFLVEQKEVTSRPEKRASMVFSSVISTRNAYQEKLDLNPTP